MLVNLEKFDRATGRIPVGSQALSPLTAHHGSFLSHLE